MRSTTPSSIAMLLTPPPPGSRQSLHSHFAYGAGGGLVRDLTSSPLTSQGSRQPLASYGKPCPGPLILQRVGIRLVICDIGGEEEVERSDSDTGR